MMDAPNVNTLWGRLIVEELVRNGVKYFVISPGSRSAPLTAAVAQNDRAEAVICVDERGAAFHGLGIARGSGKPSAIITTSGTAVANLLPGVVEASVDHVPMILLSADRPPELRDAGANQTIDQLSLFGPYLRWKFDFPCPDDKIAAAMVLTTVDQAFAKAVSSGGPVHLNCLFREPLDLSIQAWDRSCLDGIRPWMDTSIPFTRYSPVVHVLSNEVCVECAKRIAETKGGLIIAGELRTEEDRTAVRAVVDTLQWPVYCDITSGLKLGFDSLNHLNYLHHLLQDPEAHRWFKVDSLVQFGGRMTSVTVRKFIRDARPKCYIMVDDHLDRVDPDHLLTHRLTTSPAHWWRDVKGILGQIKAHPDLQDLMSRNSQVQELITRRLNDPKNISEPKVARLVSEMIPEGHALFLANSMPIRDMDMFASKANASISVGANRGASGIDGTIATATGYCRGTGKPVTLIIGDLALVHDINSLSLVSELDDPLILVLLNNKGGGIFHFLPIADFKEVFNPYFDTPHEHDFSSAAKTFGLKYYKPEGENSFSGYYHAAIKSGESCIIEVETDREDNVALHREIDRSVMELILRDGTEANEVNDL